MALPDSSLLYATALSAIHIQALHNQSERNPAPDIARLMALSLEHFRTELRIPHQGPRALVAAAPDICLL